MSEKVTLFQSTHCFDVQLAVQLGIEESIMLHHLIFWINKNKANKKNKHDGKYWTYNSAKSLQKIFPYMTNYKINRVLNDLEDEGYIVSGNYNKINYDRTKWYALSEAFENQLLHFSKSKIELSKFKNRIVENQTPIPDSIPDSVTDIKPTDSSDKKDSEEKPSNKKQTDYKGIYDYYMTKDNLVNHRKYTKRIKIALKGAMDEAGLTEEDMKMIIDKHSQLVELSQLDKFTVPPRPIHELFGQHVTNMKTSPLLCEEYMNSSTKDRFLQTLIKKHVKTDDDKGEVNSGLVVNEKKIRTTKRADDDINGRG